MHPPIPALVGFTRSPWNKGQLIGQKRPLKPKEVWAIRVRLQLERHRRDLVLFNLASTASCAVATSCSCASTTFALAARYETAPPSFSEKTGRPVQFEITEQTRKAIRDWLLDDALLGGRFLFPSRLHSQPHISTRQYARIVHRWVERAGLDSSAYGTHSMRRTKAAQIYKKTGNLRAVQLLLGHTKLESTVRYLGIEVDDALSISEQVEI